MTPMGNEPLIFQLLLQYLNQMFHCMPQRLNVTTHYTLGAHELRQSWVAGLQK